MPSRLVAHSGAPRFAKMSSAALSDAAIGAPPIRAPLDEPLDEERARQLERLTGLLKERDGARRLSQRLVDALALH